MGLGWVRVALESPTAKYQRKPYLKSAGQLLE